MKVVRALLGGTLGLIWMFAGPVTYVLGVVDTWTGRGEVWVKLLISVTLDAFLAAIWPITWVLWIVMHALGQSTPLSTVLGL